MHRNFLRNEIVYKVSDQQCRDICSHHFLVCIAFAYEPYSDKHIHFAVKVDYECKYAGLVNLATDAGNEKYYKRCQPKENETCQRVRNICCCQNRAYGKQSHYGIVDDILGFGIGIHNKLILCVNNNANIRKLQILALFC